MSHPGNVGVSSGSVKYIFEILEHFSIFLSIFATKTVSTKKSQKSQKIQFFEKIMNFENDFKHDNMMKYCGKIASNVFKNVF